MRSRPGPAAPGRGAALFILEKRAETREIVERRCERECIKSKRKALTDIRFDKTGDWRRISVTGGCGSAKATAPPPDGLLLVVAHVPKTRGCGSDECSVCCPERVGVVVCSKLGAHRVRVGRKNRVEEPASDFGKKRETKEPPVRNLYVLRTTYRPNPRRVGLGLTDPHPSKQPMRRPFRLARCLAARLASFLLIPAAASRLPAAAQAG